MATLSALVQSTSATRKNQNNARRVNIISGKYVTHTKSLIVKGEAYPQTAGASPYQLTLIAYSIQSASSMDSSHTIPYTHEKTREQAFLTPIHYRKTSCAVRCSCPDYRFTWAEWNKRNKSLAGRNFPKYVRKTPPPPRGRPYRNPDEAPGLCKHLIEFITRLSHQGLIK